MTHRKPVAYRSPVFRIRGATPPLFSSVDHSPARSAAAAAAPPDLRPPPLPRQICGLPKPRQICDRRETCPPARHPRRELRSARRLEARPGPAGLASASDRAAGGVPFHCLARHWHHMRHKTRPVRAQHPYVSHISQAVAATALSAQRSTWESPACYVPAPDRAPNPELSPQ